MNELKQKLKEYKKPVIGIGVTAFLRTGPANLVPNYSIICLQDTADLKSIEKVCKVYCLERDYGIVSEGDDLTGKVEIVKKQNTSSIMKLACVDKILKSFGPDTSLLAYKSTAKVEKICSQLGINILASPAQIRDPFEDKKDFRVLGKNAGLKMIPGETLKIADFSIIKYEKFRKKYGPDLVFQLTDYTIGGGIGTFFIRSQAEFREFLGFVQKKRERGKELTFVNVTKLIKGMSASISACVIKSGVLCGVAQTQLIDIAEATAFKGRSGVWCGHDWGWKSFSFYIQAQAERLAIALGKYMASKGYFGVFGIDLVIDEKTDEVWPVECNARYTAGFPIYCQMQEVYNEPSFDTFHLLEFLKIPYKVNLARVQEQYRRPKKGAHLCIHNQTRKWVRVEGSLKGGVYKFNNGKFIWQRQGYTLQDLKKPFEFCLVERAALKGRILKPGERLVRILFKDIIAVSSSKLNDWASKVCKAVYEGYRLKVIPSRTV